MHGASIAIATGAVAGVAAVANWWSRTGPADDTRRQRIELISKPLATVAIAAFGIAPALARDHHPSGVAIVAGVVAFAGCLAGDVALLPAVDRFVAGLGAFLFGHLAFIVMFAGLGLHRWWWAAGAVAPLAVLVATAGRRILAGAAAKDASLAIPVGAYLAVISAMAVVGCATGKPAIVVGAVAFVASDSVLGTEQFVGRRRWMPLTIMATYHLALAGLAVGLWS